MYHVTDRQRVSRTASAAASRTPARPASQSRSDDGEITFHDWHPVNIQEYGIAAPDPKNPDMVYGSARTNVSLYNRKTGADDAGRARHVGTLPGGGAIQTATCARCRSHWSPVDPTHAVLRVERRVEDASTAATAGRASAPTSTRQTWEVPANAGKYASTRDAGAAGQHHRARRRRRATSTSSGRAPTTATSR